MDQGYSQKPLSEKLGIKENSRVIFLNCPPHLITLITLNIPNSILIENDLEGQFDFIQFFAQDKAELEKNFPHLKKFLKPNGALWISWKKKGPHSLGDLSENKVQEIGLQNGLVDVKVVSIDDIWSGLKFVFRVKDRN